MYENFTPQQKVGKARVCLCGGGGGSMSVMQWTPISLSLTSQVIALYFCGRFSFMI